MVSTENVYSTFAPPHPLLHTSKNNNGNDNENNEATREKAEAYHPEGKTRDLASVLPHGDLHCQGGGGA